MSQNKVAIPGLAHSSQIVWGDTLFVTTAISSRPDATFKPGLYGEGTSSEDHSIQQWKLYALDKNSGKVIWERIAFEGPPREKRHIKIISSILAIPGCQGDPISMISALDAR